jgi:hypothetical protein
MPSTVHSTFHDPYKTPGEFLRQAHPNGAEPFPIIPQRESFYHLTQPGERGTFFGAKGKSGTSGIARAAPVAVVVSEEKQP